MPQQTKALLAFVMFISSEIIAGGSIIEGIVSKIISDLSLCRIAKHRFHRGLLEKKKKYMGHTDKLIKI